MGVGRRYSNQNIYKKLRQIAAVMSDLHSSSKPAPTARPRVHSVRKRLSPDVIEALVRDYVVGMPSTALMTKYRLGKGTVLKLLHEREVKLRPAWGVRRQERPKST